MRTRLARDQNQDLGLQVTPTNSELKSLMSYESLLDIEGLSPPAMFFFYCTNALYTIYLLINQRHWERDA